MCRFGKSKVFIAVFCLSHTATHTITLHLDMTELDVASSRPVCSRAELRRYRRLGLSVEEVVEVTMKLNTLRALGINLKIEGNIGWDWLVTPDLHGLALSSLVVGKGLLKF